MVHETADPVAFGDRLLEVQATGFSLQVCGTSLKKLLAGLDSTRTDGVQAFATLKDITHQLKQASEIQTPSIIAVGAQVVPMLDKLAEYQYLLHRKFFYHRTG